MLIKKYREKPIFIDYPPISRLIKIHPDKLGSPKFHFANLPDSCATGGESIGAIDCN
jgi:hypothetical protein